MKNILTSISTLPNSDMNKKESKNELKNIKKELFELQNKFFADGRFGLLVILQGMDTSGKDGVIRHVFTSMNPMGVKVTSFKKPSGEELNHDFLWRIYPYFPAKGIIRIFNRSYYEDILVPMVSKTLELDGIHHRYQIINMLEEHLKRNNIHILKFFLNISKDKQKEKIDERKTKPHKKWKYEVNDEETRKDWDEYLDAYNMVITNCNQEPWHIIASDKRWNRNFEVAQILLNHFKSLELKYPNQL